MEKVTNRKPKQPFTTITKGDKKLNVTSNLDVPQEEVQMIREMLASKSKNFVPNMGMVEMSDYTGAERKVLADRLYSLLYLETVVEEEPQKAEISPDAAPKPQDV